MLRLLKNVTYTGKIRQQGEIYAGEHAAIVEDGVWQQVQRLLEGDGRSEPRKVRQPPMADPAAELQSCSRAPRDRQTPASVENSSRMVSRVTRLLALAVKFEGMRQDGIVKNYSALAQLGRISRARVTQIMNLLNLAPDIQESILLSPRMSVPEASIRAISAEVIWSRQREHWQKYFANEDFATRSHISLIRQG